MEQKKKKEPSPVMKEIMRNLKEIQETIKKIPVIALRG